MNAILAAVLRPLRIGDFAVFLLLLMAVTWPLWRRRPVGVLAQVSWPGGQRQVDLRTDATFTIDAPLGTYQLQVQQGQISIHQAPCPNGTCIRQGWCSSSAQGPLVCVPGGLVVRVMGSGAEDSVDAVSR